MDLPINARCINGKTQEELDEGVVGGRDVDAVGGLVLSFRDRSSILRIKSATRNGFAIMSSWKREKVSTSQVTRCQHENIDLPCLSATPSQSVCRERWQ